MAEPRVSLRGTYSAREAGEGETKARREVPLSWSTCTWSWAQRRGEATGMFLSRQR